MGCDAGFSQVGDEISSVEPLVGLELQLLGRTGGVAMDHIEGSAPFRMTVRLRQFALHDKNGAVFHQRMADEAEHGAGARVLLVEPGIGGGDRVMGGIRALLALEIDLSIAVAVGVAEHLVGLCGCIGRLGFRIQDPDAELRRREYAFRWTRLSCKRFRGNEVRLQLHALACNLATFLRCNELLEAMADCSLTTLQLNLIKIGARFVRHARAITFQLVEVAVTGPMVRAILAAIRRLRAPPSCA
jgi:hypothetical protein